MKTVGGLWPGLTSFGNLLAAAEAAARGKRQRPDVARFLLDLEPELAAIRRELLDGSYTPGPYREFRVFDPKPRNISAAPFRDRVVHHALTQILEPIFERRFTGSSYACRKGLGTHKALEKARRAAHNYPYVLKCDIRQYFPSMDHEILKGLVRRTRLASNSSRVGLVPEGGGLRLRIVGVGSLRRCLTGICRLVSHHRADARCYGMVKGCRRSNRILRLPPGRHMEAPHGALKVGLGSP